MGTTTLSRALLVDTTFMGVVTDALGGNTADYKSEFDIDKGLKLAAAAYIPVAIGNELEGFVNSVEPGTRNSGYSWGGVQTKGRIEATVGSAQNPAMAIGDIVCSGAPTALGTLGNAQVMSAGTGYVAPASFKWRCIGLGTAGTGAVGTTVLLERI